MVRSQLVRWRVLDVNGITRPFQGLVIPKGKLAQQDRAYNKAPVELFSEGASRRAGLNLPMIEYEMRQKKVEDTSFGITALRL